MNWKTLLAYITGTVDQDLLLCNEYLVTENRILRSQIPGRVRLSHGERKAVGEIGLGRRGGHWHRRGLYNLSGYLPPRPTAVALIPPGLQRWTVKPTDTNVRDHS